MKILTLTLIFIFSSHVFAQTKKSVSKVSKTEKESFLEAFKEQEVQKQLLSSEQFKDCKKKDSNIDAIRNCVKEKLDKLDDATIKSLSESFNLSSFDKKASKSSKTIREYLDKRLDEAIYGRKKSGDSQKLKDQKYANHEIYYKLYMEQIGKNTLLHVSQYCLENFGGAEPTTALLVDKKKADDGSTSFFITKLEGLMKYNGDTKVYDLASEKDIKEKAFGPVQPSSPTPTTSAEFWKDQSSKIKEYDICSGNEESKCEGKRLVSTAQNLKKIDFILGKDKVDSISSKYEYCAGTVIQNMCEIYKCNNAYDPSSPKSVRDNCFNTFGITVKKSKNADSIKLADSSNESKGKIACNLTEKLKDYRQMLIATKKIQEDYKLVGKDGRTSFAQTGIEEYENKGKNSVDNLTSISSTELVENVTSLKDNDETAKNLEETCLERESLSLKEDARDNPACATLIAGLNKKSIENIEAESEAKTELFLKNIRKLKDSPDELTKFLEQENMKKYLEMRDGKKLTDEDLVTLIEQDYKAKKMSEIDAIKERFRNEIQLDDENKTDLENKDLRDKIAKENLADVKQHKDRITNLFQYSNIASSYLEVTSGEGKNQKTEGSNTTGRRLEYEDSKNAENKNETYELPEYFSEGIEQRSSDSQSLEYMNVLDAVLGIKTEDAAKKN